MKCLLSYDKMKIDNEYGRVLLYPNLSFKYAKEVKCSGSQNYYGRLLLTAINPFMNFLDQLSVRSYRHELLITEAINDDCQFTQSYSNAYQGYMLTLKDQALVIKSKEEAMYTIGQKFL